MYHNQQVEMGNIFRIHIALSGTAQGRAIREANRRSGTANWEANRVSGTAAAQNFI